MAAASTAPGLRTRRVRAYAFGGGDGGVARSLGGGREAGRRGRGKLQGFPARARRQCTHFRLFIDYNDIGFIYNRSSVYPMFFKNMTLDAPKINGQIQVKQIIIYLVGLQKCVLLISEKV